MATKAPQPIEGTPNTDGATLNASFSIPENSQPSSSTPKPTGSPPEGTGSEAQPSSPTVEGDRESQPALKVRSESPVNPEKGEPFQIYSNINILRYLRMLVYAEYGAGKTLLAGTAAGIEQMRDVLMISAEKGELTLFDPTSNDLTEDTDAYSKIPFEEIDIVQVEDYATTARVYDFLKLHCSVRDKAAKGDEEARKNLTALQRRLMPSLPDDDRLRLYRTVIVDTITEVEVYCMQQLLGIDFDTKMDEEINNPEWAEYNKQRQMVHRMIRNFRNLPCNIIFTCQRQFKENEQKRRIYGPMMTGKLSAEVQGFMDLVGHLVVGEPTAENPIPPRKMYIQPGPRHAAKNRFRRFREVGWLNPTIPQIVEDVGLKHIWDKYGVMPE